MTIFSSMFRKIFTSFPGKAAFFGEVATITEAEGAMWNKIVGLGSECPQCICGLDGDAGGCGAKKVASNFFYQ